MGVYAAKQTKNKWEWFDSREDVPDNYELQTALEKKSQNSDLFWGDLYIDVDNEDLDRSYSDTLQVYNRLKNIYSVKPKIYFSGKKGFHIVVPEETFKEKNEPVKDLPKIYKLMVKTICDGVKSVDYAVYSCGKGRLLRVEGCYRESTGFYKKRIPEGVFISGLDEIKEFSKIKRVWNKQEDFQYSEKLGLLYQAALFLHTNKNNETKKGEGKNFNGKAVPPCLASLSKDWDNIVKEGIKFNDLTILISTYFKDHKDFALKYFDDFLKGRESKSYPSYDKRKKQLEVMLDFVKNNDGYVFSCGFAKKCLTGFSCVKCFYTSTISEDIVIENDGFYKIRQLKNRIEKTRISNFILQPEGKVSFDGEINLLLTIEGEGKTYHKRIGNEIKEVKKFVNWLPLDYWYSGTAVDLQKIGSWLMRLTKNDLFYETSVLGYHFVDEQVYWLDHSVCVNKKGEKSRNFILNKESAVVKASFNYDDKNINVSKVLSYKDLKFNSNKVVSVILGWYAATFLRPFLKQYNPHKYEYFPVLLISGLSGSGKTQTAMMLRQMYGFKDLSMQNFNSTTNFVKTKYLTGSNVHPLFLDEFKKSLGYRNIEGELLELIRQVYGSVEGFKGRADQSLVKYKREAPLIVIGEEVLREKAAYDRIVMAYLRSSESSKHFDTFNNLVESPDLLRAIGFRLTLAALQYDKNFDKLFDEGKAFVSQYLPKWLSSRVVYNYTYLYVGAKFFMEALGYTKTIWQKLFEPGLINACRSLDSLRGINPESEINTFFTYLFDAAISAWDGVTAGFRLEKNKKVLFSDWFKVEFYRDASEYGEEHKNLLYINFTQIYNKVLEYRKIVGITDYLSDASTLTLALKHSDALLEEGVEVKDLKQFGSAVKCDVFNLDALRNAFGEAFYLRIQELKSKVLKREGDEDDRVI